MSDQPQPNEMEKETIYVFESEEDRFLKVNTDVEYEIVEIGKGFLVDSHMHIESLNCTPLQLQWATTFLNTGLTMPKDRKSLTDFLHNWAIKQFAMKDFGVIGQYYTDSIGKMYMGKMELNSTRIALKWMANKDSDKSRLKNQEKRQDMHDETTNKKLESLNDFFTCPTVSKYYTYFKPFHINIAHPMDLCYAHFWGVHRIPMYLKIPGEDQFYFIDDYRKISSVVTTTVSGERSQVKLDGFRCQYDFDPLKQGWLESGGIHDREHHLLYDFPLEEEYNKFVRYHQGGRKNVEQIVGFDLTRVEKIVEDRTISESERAEKLNSTISELNNYYPLQETGKVYHHFMEKVPLDTMEIYEDYSEQMAYYAATALRFPMKFLPFYHFDPRRHYNSSNKDELIPQLLKDHRFHVIEDHLGSEKAQGYLNMPNILEMKAFDEKYFEELFYKGISTPSIRNKGTNFISQAPYKKDIEEAKYNLFPQDVSKEAGTENSSIKFPPHLFWGVKMYPPLGYAPDLYAQSMTRYGLSENSYTHLKEFYHYCQEAQIPITAHGSPLGMSIGDGFNYIMNDRTMKERNSLNGGTANDWFNWVKRDSSAKREEYSRKECALYVDQTNTHALAWKRVIQDFPNIRFCFAHFSSNNNWERDFSLSPDLATMTRLLNKYKEKNEHLTKPDDTKEIELKQLADWRRIITDCITATNHIFTDISCYVLSPEERGSKNIFRRQKDGGNVAIRETIGKNIVAAMEYKSALFDRIMMGSDWYMSERSANGTGEYYKGMFLLLKEISAVYKEGKYDLWHQFSVVNPLRFLGLISDDPTVTEQDENGDTYYMLNTDKIVRYLTNLNAVVKENHEFSAWWEYASISMEVDITGDTLDKVIPNRIEAFSDTTRYRVYTAESMMNRKEINIGSLCEN